jgi:hypothetical protein
MISDKYGKTIMKWAESAQSPKEVVLSEAEHIADTSIYVCALMSFITRLSSGFTG